jgi:hypothetical protein
VVPLVPEVEVEVPVVVPVAVVPEVPVPLVVPEVPEVLPPVVVVPPSPLLDELQDASVKRMSDPKVSALMVSSGASVPAFWSSRASAQGEHAVTVQSPSWINASRRPIPQKKKEARPLRAGLL